MYFGNALHLLINFILVEYPTLGLALLNKVDLSDLCMCIWDRLEEIPSIAFLVL